MNSESKHTPGPWRVEGTDDHMCMNMTVICAKDWKSVPTDPNRPDEEPGQIAIVFHQCPPYVGNGFDDFNDANARLIAAAPDLLAACQALVANNDALREGKLLPEPEEGSPVALARAAIAKTK